MKKNKLPYQKSNFTVPEGYFETLQDRIMASVTSAQDKEPSLKDNKETGFIVPENYFGNFETRLFERIENGKKPSKIVQLFNKESYYYIAATAAVFIALVTTTFFPSHNQLSIDTIEMTALENYIEAPKGDLHYNILDLAIEEGIDPVPKNQPEIKEEAIIEYLNENLEETAIIFNGN
ncbi:MAG TPA: hypothetical protein VFI78_00545 [Salinimicrobium sp.]|nr:hypothetical protein [Salinimicrobium sp.]